MRDCSSSSGDSDGDGRSGMETGQDLAKRVSFFASIERKSSKL